jgi:hypothetical protein
MSFDHITDSLDAWRLKISHKHNKLNVLKFIFDSGCIARCHLILFPKVWLCRVLDRTIPKTRKSFSASFSALFVVSVPGFSPFLFGDYARFLNKSDARALQASLV